ncbi:MAG: sulfatase [Acidobacteria bacterium]|nr:sulfatase [Acidobacteriota bacterium]
MLACAASVFAQKPNFVFILADDLGWRDLGVYGSTYYETPNIDRLAAEGVRFTDAYAAGNSCSPTRGSILTGKYPATTQLTDWIPGRTPPGAKLSIPKWTNYLRHGETTIAEALAGAGYRSAAIGKWHLGQKGWWPEDQGFEVSVGGSHAGSHGSMFPPYWPAARIARMGWRGFLDERNGEYLTDRLTREAEAFLEQSAGGPFLLYLSHYAVHTPIQAKPELVAKYKAKGPSGGQSNPEYAAMVEGLDQSVGAVLAKLDALGLTDNTVVFFFSDNGGLSKGGKITSNEPLRGEKSTAWEGGVRVPLIVRWPGKAEAGRVVEEPVISVDFFPTMLEMAGVDPAPGVDGKSLVDLLEGKPFERGPIFWHYPHYNAHTPVETCTPYGAIREGPFKLIERYEDGALELYDLREDIGETRDLARAMPDKTRELAAKLAAWRRGVGAQMPTPNPAADPATYREYKEKKLWEPVDRYEQQTAFPEP